MQHTTYKRILRERRRRRIRKKVKGTAERPRLSVFRSNRHIYAQIIDDQRGHTLAAASTLEKGLDLTGKKKSEKAREVGRLIAERARQAGVDTVVFDRGGNLFHGRVKALAEGAREGGLRF